MKVIQYTISVYTTLSGNTPYLEWFNKLKNPQAHKAISRRLMRVKNGNFGDYKQLSHNLYELRIITGAGYRVYYTVRNNEIVLLLLGGDKSSQSKDIEKAKILLEELENE